ncbi:MAG: adaptor protein MecA [Vagococcus sp.]
MEMERINENTIRVSIGNEDLEERGITFLDLLGNQKQIEHFFYSILEEVDVDEQFQETDSVTFQVLPNRDGLELFISKNIPLDDAEDLTGLSANLGSEGFTDFLKQHLANKQDEVTLGNDGDIEEEHVIYAQQLDIVLRLKRFEDMISIAKLKPLHDVFTNLYLFRGDYYLHVSFTVDSYTEDQMQNEMAYLLEYGFRTNVTEDILSEHGELLMEHDAIAMTKQYFK